MDITKKAALVVGTTALVLGSAGAAGAQSDGGSDTESATDPAVTTPEDSGTNGTNTADAPAEVTQTTEAPVVQEAAPATDAPAAPAAPVAAAPAAAPAVAASQQLPVTGGEATGLAALGAALVAGGGVLVWRSRGAAEV